MRIRTFVAGAVLAAAAPIPMAGFALAAYPDCPGFAFQEDAQIALDAEPAGRVGLDADGDGIACEDHFADEPESSEDSGDSDDGTAPTGPVEAGAGGTAGGPGAGAPLAAATASALVVGVLAARRPGRRRS